MDPLYLAVAGRGGCIEVREFLWGSIDEQSRQFAGDLTTAFRRARLMAGERPGLILEELPVIQQRPNLVFEVPR